MFFVQPGRGARNVRVDGAPLTGTRALRDGDVIAFDRARLECRIAADTLTVAHRVDRDGRRYGAARSRRARARWARGRRSPSRRSRSSRVPPPARRRGERGVSKATIGVATAFAVLAGVAWFAFTAKSVALDIEPTPTVVSLPDTLFKLKMGDRFLLRSGSHRVAAELPGYYPLDAEIEVGSPSDQTIALTLTKLPGLVTITTEPEVGAEVLLDGTSLGTTPLVDAEMTPGVHRLEFSADALSRGGARARSTGRRRTPELGRDVDARLGRRLVAHRSAGRDRARRRRGSRRHAGRRSRSTQRRARGRGAARRPQRVVEQDSRRRRINRSSCPTSSSRSRMAASSSRARRAKPASASTATSAAARRCRCGCRRGARIA